MRPTLVAMRPMVMLDVRVVNFSKTALDNLGVNWQTGIAGPAVGVVNDWATNSLYRLGDVTQGGVVADAFSRVEGWRGSRDPVSNPRSSNRTCGLPASGFPT
ncbi:MAG: hypothetical protein ACYDEV_05420 [Acidiferrobacter sp.]